tara:strand:- start:3002 stop:4117 length:1116 start_codon:yes stop_codon:yes gene_type:complete
MNGFMKITKVQTPPKDIAQFSGANYPVEDEGINPEDVVEIFNTPLTGSYNWDYTVQDNRIKKLYELGKEKNWNVEEDINWNEDEGINPDSDAAAFMFFDEQWKGHKDYEKLTIEQRKDFVKDLNNWTLSQLLHGEQGALLVASQLTSCAPTFNAKLYAASQTFDEARHVEAFNKYIQTRVGRMFPIGTQLKALLDKILTDERWDLKFIGMQIIIEGLALAIFNTIKQTTTDPVLRNLLTLIIRDEARHVTFGVNYLESFVHTLTPQEKEEREDFCLEACTVLRNRFKQYDVWENWGFDVEYTDSYITDNDLNTQFQELLFTRIMPNLKKVGLLPDRLLPKYDMLGISRFQSGESDYETSWDELSKPLEIVK